MNSGAQAEQWAAQYLLRQGLQLVEQNYRTRFGEIDLIMKEAGVLVFVEVRLRSNEDYGGAAASIDAHKQRRVIIAAQQYLTRLARIPPCRFDVLLLNNVEGERVQWLKNAFDLGNQP